MIRLVGAALLTGGATALGLGGVRRLDRRVQDLNQLLAGLAVIKREMDWRITPLPELLTRAAGETRGRVADFFRLCSVGARHLNGRPFRQIWQQGLEAAQLWLEPSDLTVVEQLGGVLGRYDGESQRQALEQTLIRLEDQRKQAADRQSRMGKVYGMLGMTAGIFLMILLI